MARTGFGWANAQNKPSKKSKRTANRWDVDSNKAERIYGSFKQWDRPESAYGNLISANPVPGTGYVAMIRAAGADPAMVKRLTTAATMVQTFVDALSGKQSNYTVSIDSSATTASSDLKNRVMRLPAKTILDPEITEQEAALLMVAFLGHEIGHVRFDNDIDVNLRQDKSVLEQGLYTNLSTILREARVEAGFSSLFPGYDGLFEPLLRWISRGTKDGSTPPTDALGFAVAATRYPFRFDWSKPEHAAERDWWVQWVNQYATADDYPTHKQALDEAYAHIKATLNQPQGQPYSGQGQPQGQGNSGQGQPQGQPYSDMAGDGMMSTIDLQVAKNQIRKDAWDKKNELRAKTQDGSITWDEYYDQAKEIDKAEKSAKAALTRNRNAAAKQSASIPASIEQVEAIRNASLKASRSSKEQRTRDDDVQSATAKANTELGLHYDGRPIRPAGLSGKQSRHTGLPTQTDADAASIFRSAFMRLRGGNDGRIGGKRSGRLNDRAIYRLADRQDDRVFTRRGAPKTQALRVYLMVDTSGSMGGQPERQIRGVAKALVEASIGANNLTLEVWGWDTVVCPVWERGNDPEDVDRLVARGGTNDGGALKFAIDRMQKSLRVDEHGLIIMMSDGEGDGEDILHTLTEQARRLGMSVFGITMDESLDQTAAYGQKGFVKWQGSVAATAQPLAEIITQSWMTKDQHRA